ncbi:class I adenylate-forming enzyme family protein [Nocardia sp.]|uniref:class I adenylate-forming enzyme family protein n=1 Tax=Nocardia sp. TaxID=1821 RepID=UPI002619BD26|nr:AMP-binding protein [Nocardia sp.]
MTLWDLIATAAHEHPDRVLFSDDYGRSLTTEQFRDAAERVAAGLRLRTGQVVSWQLPTVLEAPVLLAALARVGVVQNPLVAILRESEIGLITRQVSPELLIVPRVWRGFAHGDMVRGLDAEVVGLDLEALGSGRAELRLPMGDPATLPPPPTDPTEVRWLYFSSGTTAAPKGAQHTDLSVIASSSALTDALGLGDGDVYPIAWAYPHIGGASVTAAILRRGGRLVLFDSFDPAATVERMAVHRPTVLGSATPFFRAYLDAQHRKASDPLFPALRAFVNGGAAIPPDMIDELAGTFGVRHLSNSWGLTEFPCATALAGDDPGAKVGTVGRPASGVRVRVVDGELRLQGPQCFAGYLDSTLDAAAFDADGWFRTGDLGTLDAGFVSVAGRLKEIIIRNAENISALEVENALRRHRDVVDAAVVGVPDARTGERVCAVLVTRPGVELTLKDIAAHCRIEGLARYKTPEQLETVTALPRNAMGKVLKQQLQAHIGQGGDGPR